MFGHMDSRAEVQVWRNVRLLQKHSWRAALIRLVRLVTGEGDGDGTHHSFPKIKSKYLRRLEKEYLKTAVRLRKGFPKPSLEEYIERLGEARREMEIAQREIIASCDTFSALLQEIVPEDTIGGFDDVTRQVDRLFMLAVRLCDTEDDLTSVIERRRVATRVRTLQNRLVKEYDRLIPRFKELKFGPYTDAMAKLAYLSGEQGQKFSCKTYQKIRKARRGRKMLHDMSA